MSKQKTNRYEVRTDDRHYHKYRVRKWAVYSLGPKRSYRVTIRYFSKATAIVVGRQYARSHAPSQLRVRDLKGRWKIEASYGVDSKRRKG